jgi:GAF domain-containing protein
VSASIGLASWPDDGGSKDVLLAHADASLYAMKGAARSRRATATAEHAETAERWTAEDLLAAGGTPLLRERLAMANRLSAKLAPVLGPARIAEVAVGELHRSFAELLAYMQRVEGDRLQVLAVGGTVTEIHDVPLWSQGIDEGVSGRVARSGRPALVHDTSLDPDHLGAELVDPSKADEVALRSQLAVPLHVDGRVWGVLSIQAADTAAYCSDDVLLLETVAAQVSAALHRSELAAELERARGGTSA